MNTIDTPVFKTLTRSNIDDEHICCSFSDKKCQEGYLGKKEWLKAQFDQGYVFRKLDVRGKVFIEYVPAENGWVPLEANGYMLINCFWVSGRYKGQGYAKQLLISCESDAKKMKGVVVVTGKGKKPFMSDPRFFKKQGFAKVDEAPPYFELWCKKWDAASENPRFKSIAKEARCDVKKGLAVYYTPACPFNQYYVEHELKEIARKMNIPLAIRPIITKSQAQNHFVPHTLYSVFYKGEFVTQHILNEKQFDKYIQ